jgi:hypothetical protein
MRRNRKDALKDSGRDASAFVPVEKLRDAVAVGLRCREVGSTSDSAGAFPRVKEFGNAAASARTDVDVVDAVAAADADIAGTPLVGVASVVEAGAGSD